MKKDHSEDLGAKIAGSVKEAIGRVTGDTNLEAEGSAETAAGTVKDALAGAKGDVRNTVRK